MRPGPAAAAILALSLLPGSLPHAQGVRPDIVLNKEVYRHPKLGDHIRMTHTVARGDNLWKALTKVYGWDRDKIPEALREVEALNPSLRNPNLIYPKQKLILPVPVPEIPAPTPPAARTPAPAPEPSPTARPQEPTPTQSPTPIPRLEIRIGLPSADTSLPAGFHDVVEGIKALFSALGQPVQASGELSVPIPSGGTITVDASHYPIITLPGGRKLLVDLFGGIEGRNRELLAAHWPGGEVFSLGAGIPPRLIIDRLLEAARFPRFLRKEEITCGRQATLTLVPDWQVVAGTDPLAAEKIVLVSWLEAGDRPLPAEWTRFLARFGFATIQIGPGAVAAANGEGKPKPVAFDLRGLPVDEAVEGLLRGLGLATRRGLSIQVSDRAGLPSPPVTIDLTVTRGSSLYLIDFGHLRPEEVGLLSSYRERLVVISPSEMASHWIPRLTGALGLRGKKVNAYFTEGADGRAILKVPTVQIPDEAGLIVFADGELDPDLLYYLRRHGDRIGIH